MTITVTPELLTGMLNGIQNLFTSLAEAAKEEGFEMCRDSWHNPESGATYVCRMKENHDGKTHADVFIANVEGRKFGVVSVWEKEETT